MIPGYMVVYPGIEGINFSLLQCTVYHALQLQVTANLFKFPKIFEALFITIWDAGGGDGGGRGSRVFHFNGARVYPLFSGGRGYGVRRGAAEGKSVRRGGAGYL